MTFQGKIDYLKDKLAKIEQAKSQFAFHVYEHVKEQCPNADATFKENLITMVGVPGFHLLEEAGYIELLSFSPTTMLKTSFMPSSRTEKCTASIKTIGYTGDKGRFCHSSIFGRSLSVIPDTIPSLTSNHKHPLWFLKSAV